MTQTPSEKVHYPALDGLRGIGFLIVFVAHAGQAYKSFYIAGKVGVGLFFVLSAYFLTQYFARKMSDRRVFSDWKSYFMRRIMRIYPMYVVVLMVEFLIGKYSALTVMSHLLLIDGRQHYWTIPVEFQFYVLMPVLTYGLFMLCKSTASRVYVLIGLFIVTILAYNPLAAMVVVPYASQTSILFYLSSFLVGVLLAVVPCVGKQTYWRLLMYVSLFVILLSFPYSYDAITKAKTSINLMWIFTGYSILWALVVAGLIHQKSLIRNVVEHQALRYLGTISYSAYLVHILVLAGVRAIFPESVLVGLLLSGLVTIAIASLTYKYIEKPFMNLI